MDRELTQFIHAIADERHGNPHALVDILWNVQARFHGISPESIDLISRVLGIPRVVVEDTASFYSFFSKKPKGRIAIGVGDCIIDVLNGSEKVMQAFTDELGIGPGHTTDDGQFSLEYIPYIGVPDQAPAIMLDTVILTGVKPEAVPDVLRELRDHKNPRHLTTAPGDGNNAHPLVKSAVKNNIRVKGPVIFDDYEFGAAIPRALARTPDDVIMEIKTARIRGRGGAGFPTGMKWDLARRRESDNRRFVICNADEGEPGTFKDRVILTERHDLVFDGMTICAYAIGATKGILYLRGEYAYLKPLLEDALEKRRTVGLLGADIGGVKGFTFDIRVKLGAGAYVCGEETALISSCEGNRGDPKNRPPFPVQSGYLGFPTVVNNVQTFCCAARVAEKGSSWFTSIGTADCPGTAVLSVSGDCAAPGIYEVPYGMKLRDVLDAARASDPYAVVIGGPSGSILNRECLSRSVAYDDLSTSGAIMVFGASRDVLGIVEKFSDFFIAESCGFCTPCRVGTQLIRRSLRNIRQGRVSLSDLEGLERLGAVMKTASRCGLGATAPNAVLSTLREFRDVYEERLAVAEQGLKPSFNIFESLAVAEGIAGRTSTYFPH
jgi:[NiFe] hydrogenase diaphorase moiety large subunit